MKNKIKLQTKKKLGIIITGEKFKKDGFFFDFPDFPEGKEYPMVVDILENSEAYKVGLRKGNILLELNGFSFYKKDIETIMSDFEYEKRSSKFLEIIYL